MSHYWRSGTSLADAAAETPVAPGIARTPAGRRFRQAHGLEAEAVLGGSSPVSEGLVTLPPAAVSSQQLTPAHVACRKDLFPAHSQRFRWPSAFSLERTGIGVGWSVYFAMWFNPVLEGGDHGGGGSRCGDADG